jgi:hypothetical protein
MDESWDINAAFFEKRHDIFNDENASLNFFNQVMKLWIEPEISKRKQQTILPEGFKICRCLIRLPQDRDPIVEFNDEGGLKALVKVVPGTVKKKGELVYVHEIKEIGKVLPPEVEGKRVDFVYIYSTGHGYQIIFDFTQSSPSEKIIGKEENWELGDMVADFQRRILTEKVIRIHDKAQALLQKIGLWAAPALLPYPLNRILHQLSEDDTEGARKILVEHCTPEFIENLSPKWQAVKEFEKRNKLIQEALDAHKKGQFRLSIYALLPQIEGIITDWIYTKLPRNEIPWHQKSKTKKFGELILERPSITNIYKRMVESAVDFTVEGPILKTFKNWFEKFDETFPGRHFLQHGRYDDSLFTNENSIKLFLLLDTIFHILSVQSKLNNDSNRGC